MTDFPKLSSQKIDDVTISYLLYEGVGETLVLLHATGFLSWLWHPIASSLNSRYRIIAPNLCHHRRADPYQGGLDWFVLAADIARLLRELRVERPILIGHSMGGTVLAIAAGAGGIKPQAMVLIEPVFLLREIYQMELRVEDHPLAAKSIRRSNGWSGWDEARRYLQTHRTFAAWDEEVRDLYLNHGMEEVGGEIRLVCSPQQEAAIFMGGLRYDPWTALPNITCPVLVVEGGESDHRQYVDLKKLAGEFPHGQYLLVPHGSHFMPMERPREMAGIIEDFLGCLATGCHG